MKRTYEVTFDMQKHKRTTTFMIHVDADSKDEARAIAEKRWSEISNSHMFHLKVRWVKPNEVINYMHWFVAVDEKRWKQ